MSRTSFISIWFRSTAVALLAISAVAMTGCDRIRHVQAKIFGKNGSKSGDVESGKKTSGKGQSWSYFQVKKGVINDMVQFDGKLEASERIELRSDKRMRLGPAKFKVADRVRRGDVLFAVDTKEFEQKRVEAQESVAQLSVDIKASTAQFAFASKQLERKTGLVEKGIAAQKELEEAQKSFVAAEADLKTKELELRKAERELAAAKETVSSANVISPIDGIVASIAPGGDEVNQGQGLAVVANPAQLTISGVVDETSVTKFKVGQKVDVYVDAVPDKKIAGSVKSIETAMAQQGAAVTSYNVFVAISPELVNSLGLRDGYAARIRAVFSSKENTLVIPRSGIKQNGKDTYAMVADAKDQMPSARAVKLGVQTELETEVLTGLRQGEYVAVSSDVEGQAP